jgi:cyclopropane fatty-acyl-phospholipid synthase-like methyltransferase
MLKTCRFVLVVALPALVLAAGCSTDKKAEETEPRTIKHHKAKGTGHAEKADHAKKSDHQKKRFTQPEKLAKSWNAPERDEWQRPQAVVDAMNIGPGMTVADVGTGTGYFVPYLSEAVGDDGRVFAVDIESAMLDYVDQLSKEKGLENVETILSAQTKTNLEPNSTDRVLIVNTWHHIPDRAEYAKHLKSRLTEDGSVWIVDYTRESPSGPPKKHRLKPEEIVQELEAGGFDAEVHSLELDRQYMVVGRLN